METKSNHPFYIKKDFWVGIVIIIISLLLIYSTGTGAEKHFIFPRFIFYTMALSGLWIALASLRSSNLDRFSDIKFTRYEVIVFMTMLLCVILLKTLGFYTAMTIFSTILVLLFRKDFSAKGFLKALVYALTLNIILYLIFSVALNIMTPTGVFV